MELREVDPNQLSLVLRRLRQVAAGDVRDKEQSLRSKGQMSPLVATEHEGQLVLVDGFARQAAAVRLGMPSVVVEVMALTAVQMKAQIYLRNRERGLRLIEECRLVCELCEVEGLSQVDVAVLLERHKSWVCRRHGMWKALSPRLLAEGGLQELEGGSVRRLALLPVCNQEELIAVSRREALGARETTALIGLWAQAPDSEARRYLIDHPREAIEMARASAQERKDPRLGKVAAEVLQSMVVMRQSALRAIRRVRVGMEELHTEGAGMLRRACELAESDCPWAIKEVRRYLPMAKEDT